jgi:type I restriction enzyme S subunit
MKPYPNYKPSGVKWIDDIPEHWDIMKLKYVSDIMVSNVDKKSNENEKDVSLCNYVDVYKNEFIDKSIKYMEATANESEIKKFHLIYDDVIITKDSEDYKDIAKPAYVKENIQNLVCGYHLAIIRSNPNYTKGGYLFRLFQSKKFNAQFTVAANGVTRYGLGLDAVTNCYIPIAPISEQNKIKEFLDNRTSAIDSLIEKKQRSIILLQEEKTALIDETVTKGLNPNVKMKDSGIPWLGEIPVHWDKKKMKYMVDYIKGHAFKTDLFQPTGTPIVKASDIKRYMVLKGKDYISSEIATQFEKVRLCTGDIIVSTVGSTPDVVNSAVGQIARIPKDIEGALLNQNTVKLFSADENRLHNDFLFYYLISYSYRKYLDLFAHGTANQASLNIEDMLDFIIAIPDQNEQSEILDFLNITLNDISVTIDKIENEIEFLNEYRTSLISEAVLGKIDVRDYNVLV